MRTNIPDTRYGFPAFAHRYQQQLSSPLAVADQANRSPRCAPPPAFRDRAGTAGCVLVSAARIASAARARLPRCRRSGLPGGPNGHSLAGLWACFNTFIAPWHGSRKMERPSSSLDDGLTFLICFRLHHPLHSVIASTRPEMASGMASSVKVAARSDDSM